MLEWFWPNYHAYNSYRQQKWPNFYTYDFRKDKTDPFICKRSHPIGDNTKILYLENANKNDYLLRNTNKNHFLDNTNGRKKPI